MNNQHCMSSDIAHSPPVPSITSAYPPSRDPHIALPPPPFASSLLSSQPSSSLSLVTTLTSVLIRSWLRELLGIGDSDPKGCPQVVIQSIPPGWPSTLVLGPWSLVNFEHVTTLAELSPAVYPCF